MLSVMPKGQSSVRWDEDNLELLKAGIQKYGNSAANIREHFLPHVERTQISNKLATKEMKGFVHKVVNQQKRKHEQAFREKLDDIQREQAKKRRKQNDGDDDDDKKEVEDFEIDLNDDGGGDENELDDAELAADTRRRKVSSHAKPAASTDTRGRRSSTTRPSPPASPAAARNPAPRHLMTSCASPPPPPTSSKASVSSHASKVAAAAAALAIPVGVSKATNFSPCFSSEEDDMDESPATTDTASLAVSSTITCSPLPLSVETNESVWHLFRKSPSKVQIEIDPEAATIQVTFTYQPPTSTELLDLEMPTQFSSLFFQPQVHKCHFNIPKEQVIQQTQKIESKDFIGVKLPRRLHKTYKL